MDAVSYSEARNNLASLLDRTVNDQELIIITRRNQRPAVLMSLDEYNALHETLHLLRSPANAKRLMDAAKRYEANKFEEHDLINPEDDNEDTMGS